jgi:site-specific DNA-methyltransferase (cytosine-N4-specific)
MRSFPAESIDMVIFSPPYYGLRDYGEAAETIWGGDPNCQHEWSEVVKPKERGSYGKNSWRRSGRDQEAKWKKQRSNFCSKCGCWKGQLGLEPSWRMYIDHMVEVCHEVKRVLKKTGSMYIVIGDTYASSKCGSYTPKCLMGIPWRLVFALIDQLGFILRNSIIWFKPNSLPSSVKDRLSNTYEYVFHFVKQRKYFYNLDAIRVSHSSETLKRISQKNVFKQKGGRKQVLLRGRKRSPRDRGSRCADMVKSIAEKYVKHDLAIGRLGNFSYTDPLHTKAYNLKGKNPGDVISTKSETGIYGKDHSRPFQDYHPLGKNPGDIVQVPKYWGVDKHGEYHGKAIKDYARAGAQNASEVKLNIIESFKKNPKGKNPGDVLSIEELKKLTTEEICRLYGYDPDAVCSVCGRTYKRHVSRAIDRGEIKAHRIFIPCKLEGKNPGDVIKIKKGKYKVAGIHSPGERDWYWSEQRNLPPKEEIYEYLVYWKKKSSLTLDDIKRRFKDEGDKVSHWFTKPDSKHGFSYPTKEDWMKLKELLGFDDRFDKAMTETFLVPVTDLGYPLGKNPGDFFSISTKPFPEAHFAVYPVALLARPLLSSCPPDGIVLDPFMGSGTTALACELINRKLWDKIPYTPNKIAKDIDWNLKWIGIEINREYVEIAYRRLKPYIAQERLLRYLNK